MRTLEVLVKLLEFIHVQKFYCLMFFPRKISGSYVHKGTVSIQFCVCVFNCIVFLVMHKFYHHLLSGNKVSYYAAHFLSFSFK